MANYDHNAIYKAYPNVVRIDDSEGIFDASGNPVSIVQSNVDAARVELNKLNYRNERVGITSGYAPIQDQLDQLYHDMTDGKLGVAATTGSWYIGITSVKTLLFSAKYLDTPSMLENINVVITIRVIPNRTLFCINNSI